MGEKAWLSGWTPVTLRLVGLILVQHQPRDHCTGCAVFRACHSFSATSSALYSSSLLKVTRMHLLCSLVAGRLSPKYCCCGILWHKNQKGRDGSWWHVPWTLFSIEGTFSFHMFLLLLSHLNSFLLLAINLPWLRFIEIPDAQGSQKSQLQCMDTGFWSALSG